MGRIAIVCWTLVIIFFFAIIIAVCGWVPIIGGLLAGILGLILKK